MSVKLLSAVSQFDAPAVLKKSLFLSGSFVGLLAVFTTPVALQDAASRLTNGAESQARWAQALTAAPEGSTHSAVMDLQNTDDGATGSVIKGKSAAPAVGLMGLEGTVSIRGVGQSALDDVQSSNAAIKGDRVIQRLHKKIPPQFKAGSIVKAAHLLDAPDLEAGKSVARFVPPSGGLKAIKGKEILVATSFHSSSKPKLPSRVNVPTMLASLVTGPGDSLAVGYAPAKPDFSEDSPFDAVLKKPKQTSKRFSAPAGPKDHAWVKKTLPASVFSAREQDCLARGIYFEARGEPVKGQAAVSQVILNRVRNPHFPNSICGVVYQNKNWRNRCQFSFACDRIRDRVRNAKLFTVAKDVAKATTAGQIWLAEIGSSTHYHATYVRPRWARTMRRLTRIGRHVFYRTKNGGWT